MKQKNKLLLGILVVFLFAVMAVSAWKIWEIYSEYRAGENAYEDISQMVSLPPKPTDSPAATDEPEETEVPSETDTTVWPEVDFAALREVNPDIVAWIYIEGTEINYPVVQGSDNSYYLNHLFNGEWNGSGCIFLDSRNDANFTDQHSIIYGHHMQNGTMFASLDKYKQQEFFDEHPLGLLVTPDKNYKIEFFSGYVTAPQGDAWEVGFTESEFEDWLQNAVSRSCVTCETVPAASDHILTLSTCSYEFSNARFVLLGVLR